MNLTQKQRKEFYLILAKRVSAGISKEWFLCRYISHSDYPEFKIFKPIVNEFVGSAWFSESCVVAPNYTKDNTEGNLHRVTALLLAAAMCD